ncbi:hypothetical protein [Halomonas sp. M4R1S46]|uniref:hypothetical protein n=1 Tax=Halomonas sp. M4R1S46 TaxID=2982692 RepID=UPI0021E4E7D7|nr:hypothetical protein [Halomonas sp. M4R1S46]UYG08384.1 hypothetical protein OCT48_03315 [Halomonas sp. M4R1S46]
MDTPRINDWLDSELVQISRKEAALPAAVSLPELGDGNGLPWDLDELPDIDLITRDGEVWARGTQIAHALGYHWLPQGHRPCEDDGADHHASRTQRDRLTPAPLTTPSHTMRN